MGLAARTPNTDLALKYLETERYLEERSAQLRSLLDDSHGVHSARDKFGGHKIETITPTEVSQ